ncbi:hypothetical protein HII12_001139 [Brettanomyces bruxellensis]|uniref:DEBR0S3_00298g1_1 n=1 Tax=Dekkera bruxellensis TaxID=5007 RepID=A0A7D9CXG3_DEKBR|nr:hypothetical protein HII12_001139 [Brettanomyces bruxellensis]VUG18015.1 DEBR0S3_00298g1_1 [Brettanomyces bruxellensis]
MTLTPNIDQVVSIFWPTDIRNPPKDERLVVVGYRISASKFVVIDLISEKCFNSRNKKPCGKGLVALKALCTLNYHNDHIGREIFYDYTNEVPVLAENEVLIYFKPPNSANLEYFSIDPISINIFWDSKNIESPTPRDLELSTYCAKLEYHIPNRKREESMKEVLRYINLTNFSRSQLHTKEHERFSSFVLAFSLKFGVLTSLISTLYDLIIRRACFFVSAILEYPLFVRRYSSPSDDNVYQGCDNESAEDKSTAKGTVISLALLLHTFHQMNCRAKQFYNLPDQFKRLRLSQTESEALILKGTKFSPAVYIKFYNTVWLIVNDILLGIMVSSLLQEEKEKIIEYIASSINEIKILMYSTIIWLMNSPAGFKLNNELATFLGELILWVIDFWHYKVIMKFLNYAGIIIDIIAILVKCGGVSLFVAISVDLFNLLTLQLQGFYIACTRIYRWQYHALLSLFRLFYGKKHNILRHRIDSNAYEFDELMSGTILFTILIYLLPTIAAFYLTFATTRIACIFVVTSLDFLLISLNHLPLGVFLLRVKNKERLPGGVTIVPLSNGSTCAPLFSLRTKCLSLSQIVKGHVSSTFNFNLVNYTKAFVPISGYNCPKFTMRDILDNWNRISPTTIARSIIFGEMIRNSDYKRMF